MRSTHSIKSIRSTNKLVLKQQHSKTSKFQNQNSEPKSSTPNGSRSVRSVYNHPKDPELICYDKELPASIEEEIKEGFFELK
jgi:hypothetical protein